jgi:hypothetical protein
MIRHFGSERAELGGIGQSEKVTVITDTLSI